MVRRTFCAGLVEGPQLQDGRTEREASGNEVDHIWELGVRRHQQTSCQGHHSRGSSTKVGMRVGESMTAWRYAVSAPLSDALKRLIAAAPSAARVAAKDAGALLVSSNNSAEEVPVLVRTFEP